jgi:hypothetical protein
MSKRLMTMAAVLTNLVVGCGGVEAQVGESGDPTAQAAGALRFDPAEFPNNTRTFLAQQHSSDGVLTLGQAYLSRHLYGQDLLLDLYVKNLGYEKHFTVVNELTGQRWDVSHADDYWNHNASASWRFTTQDGKDNFWVRIKGNHDAGTRYTVLVTMNGQSYVNTPVVLGR